MSEIKNSHDTSFVAIKDEQGNCLTEKFSEGKTAVELVEEFFNNQNILSNISYIKCISCKPTLKDKSYNELRARNTVLRDRLGKIEEGLRIAATAAFKVHPDDLVV